ncbi:hypothetical protein L7F22_013072 [Adiantum nelumboides]|nr:hypothetical protein [Adiantum nelumboides]
MGKRILKAELRKTILAFDVFEKWGLDVVGPLPMIGKRNAYILIAVDHLSRWTEAKAVKQITRKEMEKFVYEHICCKFGVPLELLSGRGPGFKKEMFDFLCKKLNRHHRYNSPYYPQCNGLNERSNGELSLAAATLLDSPVVERHTYLQSCSLEGLVDWHYFPPCALIFLPPSIVLSCLVSVELSLLVFQARFLCIQVVPTVYKDIHGRKIQTNQYSVTEHFKTVEVGMGRSLPGVFFFYDLSPIKVNFNQRNTPFLHFLTNVCAIVGGVFTVFGIIDAFVYHGHKVIKKKIEIGKFS